jgi:uncharacterized membrane protein
VQHDATAEDPVAGGDSDRARSRHLGHGPSPSAARTLGRWALAGFLLFTGTAHLLEPEPFRAQVPSWLPNPEAIILVSGLIELALAIALLTVRHRRALLGWVVAGFFVAVFPGNVSQFITGTDAFGLDTDLARFVRLLIQPLFVVWALWCTGAWHEWRAGRAPGSAPGVL